MRRRVVEFLFRARINQETVGSSLGSEVRGAAVRVTKGVGRGVGKGVWSGVGAGGRLGAVGTRGEEIQAYHPSYKHINLFRCV